LAIPDPSIVDTLRRAGCVFAEDEARLLVEAASDPARLAELVAQRVAGLPLEHLLGWADFGGLRVAVGPGVFVPRQRSVFLAEQAAALAPPGAVVVDLCCGSGAVGALIASRRPGIDLYAADIDPAAVACARRNLPPERVFTGDLYEPLPRDLRGRVDVLAVNAPYVPAGAIGTMPREAYQHEPRTALEGGADGLDVVRRVAAGAPDWLAPGGHVLVEASRRQAPRVADLFRTYGLSADVLTAGDATVLIGRSAVPIGRSATGA